MGEVCLNVALQFHDRMSPMKLIYLASKNQDISMDSTEITHKKGKSWSVKKDWGKFDSMEEVILTKVDIKAQTPMDLARWWMLWRTGVASLS